MPISIYLLVLLFGLGSYTIGVFQVLKGNYKPSLFTRLVWLLLAINAYAGVTLSGSTSGSVALATVLLIGNFGMFLVSIFKGSREYEKLEIICTFLLLISAAIWIVFSAPLLNLTIALIGNLIGALPTYKKVWKDPSDESLWFWFLFFVASTLSLIGSFDSSLQKMLLPLYFVFLDGSLTVLCLRRFYLK